MSSKRQRSVVTADGTVRTTPGLLERIIVLAAPSTAPTLYDGTVSGDAIEANTIWPGTTGLVVGAVYEVNCPVGKGIRAVVGTSGKFIVVHSDY